jgi:hypothetical protein
VHHLHNALPPNTATTNHAFQTGATLTATTWVFRSSAPFSPTPSPPLKRPQSMSGATLTPAARFPA